MAPGATLPSFDSVQYDASGMDGLGRGSGSKALKFNADKHLHFQPPKELYTLGELGLSSEKAISHIAITAPFPLLSREGVVETRRALFQHDVLRKHKYTETKDPGVYKLRGYGSDVPFVYDMWRSEEMLEACSNAAGCELDVVFDYEIGHTNVQLPIRADGMHQEVPAELPPPDPPLQTAIVSDAEAEAATKAGIANVTAWHNDSYPWVCVVMLSDPTGMTGGETALRKADGSILKVRGPQMGYAVMMQGGLINHVALKSLGMGERITMVTSFRPGDPLAMDLSNLGNVKAVSELGQLYTQWSLYRAKVMEQRCRLLAEKLMDSKLPPDEVRDLVTSWTTSQIAYLETTAVELTPDGHKGNYNHDVSVVKGPSEQEA